ncbi:MAG: L-serine ammonia-lyase [Ignavibacteria bacterium]|jgi:L-serine dehydratase|nr:L-serine ammonia-lyase [Ignavibacteria bacterium]
MQSIKKIYKTGHGPSSSHTMGPHYAATAFKQKFSKAASYRVTLYGSLALTGKGHLTDMAIMEALSPKHCDIVWDKDDSLPYHPNAMKLEALDKDNYATAEKVVYSIGGGDIVWEEDINSGGIPIETAEENNIYTMSELVEIQNWCNYTGKSYWEYVQEIEEEDIWDFLIEVWTTMKTAVQNGLDAEGVIPGGLGLQRKACSFYTKGMGFGTSLQHRALLYAYTLAVSEENACGGIIVTAPTCGACGVLPGVLYYLQQLHNFSDKRILRALATAALVGNVVKTNASISGAEAGCQAEVGTACSMAAAATSQLFGGTPSQIEYAAEMAMEHHLGMTCDPVAGFVQIPCIERNAFAAARALDCNAYSMCSDGKHRITFDKVIRTMIQTGKDIPSLYRETSKGGLATFY